MTNENESKASEQKPIDIEEQYERGYFYDVYTEALRLGKENEELREEINRLQKYIGDKAELKTKNGELK